MTTTPTPPAFAVYVVDNSGVPRALIWFGDDRDEADVEADVARAGLGKDVAVFEMTRRLA